MNPGPREFLTSKSRLKWHSQWIKWGITAFGLFVLFFIVPWVLGWLVVYGLYRRVPNASFGLRARKRSWSN
jgi:hypothetical protein